MAHAGIGTYQHMASSLMLTMAGIDAVLVPFKGGGPATIDVLAGHTQFMMATIVQVSGHIKSGRLISLGIGSSQRHESFPDLPTLAEAGLPGYEADNWWGIVGPAAMAQSIVDRLISEILAVQESREMREALEKEGARPVKLTGAAFGRKISDDIAKWTRVVREAGIKIE